MEQWQIVQMSFGAVWAALSTLLVLRAQWFARRAYRSWYWGGRPVDEVTKQMRVMGWGGVILGVVYGLLSLLGVEILPRP